MTYREYRHLSKRIDAGTATTDEMVARLVEIPNWKRCVILWETRTTLQTLAVCSLAVLVVYLLCNVAVETFAPK